MAYSGKDVGRERLRGGSRRTTSQRPIESERLHSLVEELMKLLGLPGRPDAYAQLLEQNISKFQITKASAQIFRRKLMERAPDGGASFARKYEALKTLKVEEVDRLCGVLMRISNDKDLVAVLEHPQRAVTGHSTLRKSREGPFRKEDVPFRKQTKERESVHPLPTSTATTRRPSEYGAENTPTAVVNRFLLPDPEEEIEEKHKVERKVVGPPVPQWAEERRHMGESKIVLPKEEKEEEVGGDLPLRMSKESLRSSLSEVGGDLSSLPVALQEIALVDDLLYTLVGVGGQYIREIAAPTPTDPEAVVFGLGSACDPSLAHMVERIVPLCTNFLTASRFEDRHSRFEHGLVSHALCAAMRAMLKEHLILVAQLEHQAAVGKLSLQKLFFYVQPSMLTMDVLARVAHDIASTRVRGGELLNLLYDRGHAVGGDERTCGLLEHLLRSASVPYLTMLESWVDQGEIHDPYDEFMVEVTDKVRDTSLPGYWNEMCCMREEMIPVFLRPLADNILTAGKYLNVIRECGRSVEAPTNVQLLTYSSDERTYVERIQQAYQRSSQRLLDLVMREKQWIGHLKSIKHYFLLDRGDFFMHFLDMAEHELLKNSSDVSRSKLDRLLGTFCWVGVAMHHAEMSLRTSVAVNDPNMDNLSCVLMPDGLVAQLMRILRTGGEPIPEKQEEVVSGLEAFALNYTVEWPLSLVMNTAALSKYQMVFRHLFNCKYVTRRLKSVWADHKAIRSLDRLGLGPSYALRQRMLHFVATLEHYMVFDVIETRWQSLEEHLHAVENVDQVMMYHSEFLDTLLRELMLTRRQLIKPITKLLATCHIFSNFTSRFLKTLMVDLEQQPKGTKDVLAEHARDVIADKQYLQTVAKFEKNFGEKLKALLKALSGFSSSGGNRGFANLAWRLDANQFYARTME